jgi:hypothetical protein
MTDIEIAPQDKLFEDWDIKTHHDTYEIKYDRWFEKTHNVLIETHSDLKEGSLGWFFKTKAKWLIVFFNENQFYGLSMEQLRDAWYNKPSIWIRREIPQKSGRTSVCWVAPIEHVIHKIGDVRQ